MDSADDRVRQAIELAQAGKTEEARAELVVLVKTNADSAAAWAALAQLADTPRDAAYCLKQILSIQPDDEWARTHLQRLSREEAPPDQTSQIDHAARQRTAPPQVDESPRVPIKLVLSTAGVFAILCLLGSLFLMRGGPLPGLLAPATGEPTLPDGTTPSMVPTSGSVPTAQTNTGTIMPLPTEAGIEPEDAATRQATHGAVPTVTQTAQIATPTLAPSPTPSPTETQVLTPTDYPTPTDPPQPPDVPTEHPPPVVGPCDCYLAASLTCRDFDTQEQAQACYDYCLAEMDMDLSRLDSNQNGIACENLP